MLTQLRGHVVHEAGREGAQLEVEEGGPAIPVAALERDAVLGAINCVRENVLDGQLHLPRWLMQFGDGGVACDRDREAHLACQVKKIWIKYKSLLTYSQSL